MVAERDMPAWQWIRMPPVLDVVVVVGVGA